MTTSSNLCCPILVLPNSWATQVEVIAVATMFSIPLYYCKMSEDNICYWEMTYSIKNAIVHDGNMA